MDTCHVAECEGACGGLYETLSKSGLCAHSRFYADCNGCRERELSRALRALVEVHDHGFRTPIQGLSPKCKKDLWNHARHVLAITDTMMI